MKEVFDDIKSTFWKNDRLLGFRQWASENQFRIVERERFGSQAISLKSFQLFKGKKGKRLKGVLYKIERNSALRTRIYDYAYFGDSKTRTSTVFEFFLPQWNFSEMLIRPKSRFSKMKDFFRKPIVIFENLTHFHKKYQIFAHSPEILCYELNEEFLDLLADQKKLWVESNGNFILFYFKNKPLSVNQFSENYEYILDLLESLLHGQSTDEFV